MTAFQDRCASCQTLLRSAGSFCHRCGASALVGSPVERPAQRELHPRRRTRERAQQLGWVGLFFSILLLTIVLVPHLPLTKVWRGILATSISIGVTAIFCSMDLDRIRSMFDWRKLGPIDLVHTLAAAAVLFLLLNVYFAFTASIGVSTGGPVAELSGASFLAEILLVGLIAPVTEEFAFRGFILGRLEKVLRPSEAMVVQAALFSVLHLLPWSFPSHFLMGLAFGYLARVTGSLYPAIVLHMFWNAHALAGIGFS